MESVSVTIGTISSPIIRNNFGRYTNYGLKCGCTFLAFTYTYFCAKEPVLVKNVEVVNDNNTAITNQTTMRLFLRRFLRFLREFLLNPFVEMTKTIFKRRPYGVHILVALQFYIYASYTFIWPNLSLRYLYMLKTFEGFDGEDYSSFNAFTYSGCLKDAIF